MSATGIAGPNIGHGPRQLGINLPAPVIQNQGERVLIEVFTPAQVGTCLDLAKDALAMVVTAETLPTASGLLIALHNGIKGVEGRRVELKKPFKQAGDAIDEIAGKLAAPMDVAKRELKARIDQFQTERDRVAAEARRVADEQARAERQRAEADAKAQADADAKEAEALLGVPVEPEPVKLPPAPIRAPAPVAPPSVLQKRMVPKLIIEDASKIPHRIGDSILTKPIDAEIKRVLGLGVPVPGCRLEMVEETAINGRMS